MGRDLPKSALVTGCSQGGIGDALAQELHRQGYRVFASVRDPAKAAHFAQVGITDVVSLDVGNEASIRAAVELVSQATGGKLDMLVNNAGVAYAAALTDVDIDAVKRLYDINFFAVMTVTKAFTPLLIKSGQARVLNIGSVLGEFPRIFLSPYCSAKAALSMLSKIMRIELAPFGIRVIHVVTGGVATKMIHNGDYDFPETSIYNPVRESALSFVDGSRIQRAMTTPADEYARAVVANAMKSNPTARFWCGAECTLVWFVTWWPDWLLDSYLGKTLRWLGGLGTTLEDTKSK